MRPDMRFRSVKGGSQGWIWPLAVVMISLSIEPIVSSCNHVGIANTSEAAQAKKYSLYPVNGGIDADTEKQLRPNLELGADYIRDSAGAGRFHQYGQHGAVSDVKYAQWSVSGDHTVWLSGRLTFADQAEVSFEIFQAPKGTGWDVTKFSTIPQSFRAPHK
jgi:hypothetical protein